MIAIICAIASGMTIVLSRSINGYLAKKSVLIKALSLITLLVCLLVQFSYFYPVTSIQKHFIYKDRSNNVSWRNNWCL